MSGSLLTSRSFLPDLSSLGPSQLLYLFIVGGAVLCSFAFLFRPFVNLGVTIFFLVSANVLILGTSLSAAITTLLIANTLIGIGLASGFKFFVEREALQVPLLVSAIAASGAVYGFFGNRVFWVLGDFYQMIEFALMLFLARMLVKTEQQFRTMANVLVGSIVATSVLQMVDVLMEANHLPPLWREGGPELHRSINMNAPIAFVVLLAALSAVRKNWWCLAALALVEINLILGFTRGLWLATLVSAIFLLIVMRDSRGAILKFGFVAGVFAIAFLFASRLDGVAAGRVSYTFEQMRNLQVAREAAAVPSREQKFPGASSRDELSPTAPPEGNQLHVDRRWLEYLLILPRVMERPVAGAGLGATYRIAGDAIDYGPKGKIVDYHYIHDIYLQVAFRLGIPALLILLVLLGIYFRRSLGNLRTLNLSPENTALMAGLIAAMFGETLLSLGSPTLLNHPTAGVIGCIMALTTTALRQSAQQPARIDIGTR